MTDLIKIATDFVYSITTLNYEEKCIKLWNINSDLCVKCIFFILDQQQHEKVFLNCIKWLYKYHKPTFDKNLSLLLGLPNEKLIDDNTLIEMSKKDYDEHEKKLNMFVEEDYKKSFRTQFLSNIRNVYFKDVYQLPVYGNVNILKKIGELFPEDNLLKYKIEHLCKQNHNQKSKSYDTFDKQYLWVRT